MTQEIKELQTVHMVRFFGSRNDFEAGSRGTVRMWRDGDTAYIEGQEKTIAIPWHQIAAAEMGGAVKGQKREELVQEQPKRRGRPKKGAE